MSSLDQWTAFGIIKYKIGNFEDGRFEPCKICKYTLIA